MEASVPVFEHSTSTRRNAALLRWRGWPRRITRHAHEQDAEFGFITAGTGHYTMGERSFTLCPGRLYFIPPGVVHGSSGVDRRMQCWTLAMPVERLGADFAAGGPRSCATQLPPAQARRLARLFADLVAEPDDRAFDLGAAYVAASALSSLVNASSAEDGRPPVHPAVETATRLLRAEEGSGLGLTLDTLAKRCGVSRSRLTALFRTHHGMSIVQFRNQERVQRVLSLHAAQPELGMTRAAFEAGFGSYSQFYRSFRSVTGCTPAAYARDVGPSSPSLTRSASAG